MTSDVAVTIRMADWDRDRDLLRLIREEVFVHEQKVPTELEWDGIDADCAHVIACLDDGQAVATGRLLPDGHIGRIAVLKPWRRQGIGSRVLQSLIEIAKARGMASCALNAQTHALAFYQRHGFIEEGDEFDEANIPHQHMVLKL